VAWAEGAALSLDRAAQIALDGVDRASTGQARFEASASRRPGQDADRLSPREREVAALVARGLSNREIAAELVLTVGSAANYVKRILSKLGFRSRAQIAVWAAERGLAAGSGPAR
jgi:DNA-binding NarL/FixJ family response regulator